MENLKISEKLFENVIYFVLGSLDDEVNEKKKICPMDHGLYVPAGCSICIVCWVQV